MAATTTTTTTKSKNSDARYFERGDKFWEIAIEELAVVQRFGKVGTPGETETKKMM